MSIIVVTYYVEDDSRNPTPEELIQMMEELYQVLRPGPDADEVDAYLDYLAAMY